MAANNYETLKKATREMTQKDIVTKFGDGPFKLNIGCGSDIMPGYINIDVLDSADLQLDLEVGKLPFPKGSVENIKAAHIMEHLWSFPKLMNECHRILKPNGILKIFVPCYPAPEAFQDPTHVRFFTAQTLEYFHSGSFLFKAVGESYGYNGWNRLQQQHVNGWELHATLSK